MGRVKGYGGGIGMSRHRKSGKTTKSPKTRFQMTLDAKGNERKAPPPLPFSDPAQLFNLPKQSIGEN